MDFRFHPIIEGLKINEDGSIILHHNEIVIVKEYKLPHQRYSTLSVVINRKRITVQKLVCEAFHGVAPTGENAARKVDEKKGIHYSNLYWGKKGMTVSAAKDVVHSNAKMSAEVYAEIMKKSKKTSIRQLCLEYDISENRFYQYRKNHVKKNK